MILPSSCRPDRSHLAQTRAYAEVAGDAEDEAVEESGWAAGGEDDGEGACEGYPCAVGKSCQSAFLCLDVERFGDLGSEALIYFRIAKAMPVMVNFENFFSSWPTWPSAVVVWRLRESASCLSGSSFSMTDDQSTEISLMRVLLRETPGKFDGFFQAGRTTAVPGV
jgi:hypothetical protein